MRRTSLIAGGYGVSAVGASAVSVLTPDLCVDDSVIHVLRLVRAFVRKVLCT